MGEIIFWTIIRISVVIPVLWILESYISQQLWWLVGTLSIYVIIIHPAVIHYNLFKSKNKDILESTLCSTCKNFDQSAILCILHDKHPTKVYLPCQGIDWEPKSSSVDSEDIYSG